MNKQKILIRLRCLTLLIVGLVFTSVFSSSVYAFSEKGRLAGVPVRATLNRYKIGAAASTESDYTNMVHQVELTVWYYYVEPGGVVYTKKEDSHNVSESAAATHAIRVSITLPGENTITTRAISRHHVYAGHYTWGVTLIDDERDQAITSP